MNFVELIKSELKRKGILQRDLAEKMGYKTLSGFNNLLQRKEGMQMNNALAILEALDCKLIVRDADGNEYEVTK